MGSRQDDIDLDLNEQSNKNKRQYEEDEEEEDDDESLDEVYLVPDEHRAETYPRHTVPQLAIRGIRSGGHAVTGAENSELVQSNEAQDRSCRIDLLSTAFSFDQGSVERAKERGIPVEEVVSTAFHEALKVPKDQLKFYLVTEVVSPSQLQTNKHIAVAIQSSTFSLDALETMLENGRQGQRECDSYRKQIAEREEEIRRLRSQLNDASQKVREREMENVRLSQENDKLRRTIASQRSPRLTQPPGPVASPRVLVTGTNRQSHLTSGLIHMQRLATENQQLISDIVQIVRTQTVDNS